jgi:alanine dehydrogenase
VDTRVKFFDDAEIAEVLSWTGLVEAIEKIVVDPAAEAPPRSVHSVPVPGGADGAFLLKPGWVTGEIIGVKAVTVFPDNGRLDLPTVQAGFLLFDGRTGSLLGGCAANELTTRRTAAASAVAAKRLARPDARRLLMIGAGALAPMAVRAHATVRAYDHIDVWARDGAKADAVVAGLVAEGHPAVAADDLDAAVAEADVVSAATGATVPLIRGALLRPGAHVDLIGSFTAEMRESDDDVARRSTIFVDTRGDASIAGDLAQPLADGIIRESDIVADLADLVAGRHPGRTSGEEITMFKSAGIALEDLAAAALVFGR